MQKYKEGKLSREYLQQEYSKLDYELQKHIIARNIWYFEMFLMYAPDGRVYSEFIDTAARYAYNKDKGPFTSTDTKRKLVIKFMKELKPLALDITSIYERF